MTPADSNAPGDTPGRPNLTSAMFRDPAPLDPAELARVGGRHADPRTAVVLGGTEVRPTSYVGASLVMSARADDETTQTQLLDDLRTVAGAHGWQVDVD